MLKIQMVVAELLHTEPDHIFVYISFNIPDTEKMLKWKF
jgi:hypothetical protein